MHRSDHCIDCPAGAPRFDRCPNAYQRSTEQALRCHLVPFFGDRNLWSITSMMVQAYKAAKLAGSAPVKGKGTRKRLSPKSINNHICTLSRLFRSAVEWGYADTNPVTGVGLLRLPPQEFHFWDREQSDAFLSAMLEREPRWYPLFLAALRTGMRQGELFAVRWDDLDFVKKQVHVLRNFTHGELVTPRSNRGRFVPMSPELAAVLRDHRHLKGELVFCREDGTFLSGHCVRRPMDRCQRAAGLPRITFHDPRHSFASQLVMAGVPLKAVQEFLGHASLAMTMRYAHLSPEMRQDYVTCLDSDTAQPAAAPNQEGDATAVGPNLGRAAHKRR